MGRGSVNGWAEPQPLGRFIGWPIAVPIGTQDKGILSVRTSILIANAFVVVALRGLAAIVGAVFQTFRQRLRKAATKGRRRLTSLHATAVAFAMVITGGILVVSMKAIANDQFRQELNR